MLSSKTLIAGLVASMVMGMIEMIFEAVAGTGFWSPLVFIGATVLRDFQTVAIPVPFDVVAVVVGLMGHMMNSVILGVIFAGVIAPRLSSTGGRIAGGVVYSVVVFLVLWFAVLPVIDPVMLELNGLVFSIAHMMWGAVLGLMVGRARKG